MVDIIQVFSVIFYISLTVLIIVLIILAINAIKTLNKIDKLVDDINTKSNQLNGMFNLIERSSGAVMSITNQFSSFIMQSVERIFKRKRDKNE